MSKFSNICFTTFCTQDSYDWDLKYFQYYVCQHEVCPTTNKKHLQGYAEFIGKHSLRKIKKIFKDSTIHVEARKGTQLQAIQYCIKLDTREPGSSSWEHGTRKIQGQRNDIREVYNQLKAGEPLVNIINNDVNTYIKYYRGFDHIHNILLKEQSKTLRMLNVEVLWGTAGCGKSKYVYENAGDDSYRLKLNNHSLWFCGYRGEKTLIIEEFNGQIDFESFIQMLDIYPLQIPVKGSYSYALWTKVYITSNYDPMAWYTLDDIQKEALARRIHKITMLKCNKLPGNTILATCNEEIINNEVNDEESL